MAVKMPQHEPQVGQADRRSPRHRRRRLSCRPARPSRRGGRPCARRSKVDLARLLGRPETKRAGMLSRSAAISMPGAILFVRDHTSASRNGRWPCIRCRRRSLRARAANRACRRGPSRCRLGRNGVEFLGDAAGGLDLARDQSAEVLEVHVAGHEPGEVIGDRDDRLAELPSFMPVARQRPRAPAMLLPWVVVRERYGGMIGPGVRRNRGTSACCGR